MLVKDLRQMLAEALRIGHARCVVLFTIERHTDTLSSGWFHGAVSPYDAVCYIHSMGQRWNHPIVCTDSLPTTKSDRIRNFQGSRSAYLWGLSLSLLGAIVSTRIKLPLVVSPRCTGPCWRDLATRPSTSGSCHQSWHTQRIAIPLWGGDSLACRLGHSEISPLDQRWHRSGWVQM